MYFHITATYAILRHNGVDIGKRDYLANLKEYFQQDKFNTTAFIGLTGTKDKVAALAKNVGIHIAQDKNVQISQEHIEHGGALLLINPEGKLMAIFTSTDKPNAIVRDFKEIVHHYVNTV